jgi:hypothetical protein
MLAKGWTREQRVNDTGWFRGVDEDQQVIDVVAGPPQPSPTSSPAALSRQRACQDTYERSGRQDRVQQYQQCLRP